MANIHSSDAFTALTIVPEVTFGVDPGSGYLRVPFLGKVLPFRRTDPEVSREIRPFGGISSADYGAGFVDGEFTTYCYPNAKFFGNLLSNAFGGMEKVTATYMPDGQVAATYNTHAYAPQSYACRTAGSIGGMPPGLTVRGWNMGPNNTTGSIEQVLGFLIREMELTQEKGGWLKARWRGVGLAPTRIDATGLTPPALVAGLVKVTPQDIRIGAGNPASPSFVKIGATSFDLDGFTVRLSTPIEAPQRFANDPTGQYNFGIRGPRRVTGSLDFRMYQTGLDSAKPARDFLDAVKDRAIRIRFASSNLLTGEGTYTPSSGGGLFYPYTLDIFLGKVIWTEAPILIEGPGVVNVRCAFKAYEYIYADSDTSMTAAANKYKAPIVIQTGNDETEDSDAAWTAAAAGGNDLDATLKT